MATQTSPLGIPYSDSTVSVSILNSTSYLAVPMAFLTKPPIKGLDTLQACCFSFLIEHTSRPQNETAATVRRVVFDLAVRKDWATGYSPATRNNIALVTTIPGYFVRVEKDVADILAEHGVAPDAVEAVVWSHTHVDHIGNPATFGPQTDLVVGPGFGTGACGCAGHVSPHDDVQALHLFPGYPADPDGMLLESDYKGRNLREISDKDLMTADDDSRTAITICGFRAYDYFGDGSFYLLDTPGHSVGHLCGLARVHADRSLPNGGHFVLMGGDAFHHMGEFRPSPYVPLPSTLPAEFGGRSTEALLPLLRNAVESETSTEETLDTSEDALRRHPFALPADAEGAIHFNPAGTLATIRKLQALDADENVLVVAAHDRHLMDLLEADKGLFPATANDFVARGWVPRSRWAFLKDLDVAIGE